MADENLCERIFADLSEKILRWDYMPGSRLTEEALSAEFHVSRSPVREALNMLADNGLIEKKPRVGYTVRTLDLRQIEELYEVRLALEELVVTKICRDCIGEVELVALSATWVDLQARLPDSAPLVPEADEQFHEVLAALPGNAFLATTLKGIDKRLHFVRAADITSPERVEATCAEHLQLLAALRARDTTRALAVLRQNIEGGRSSVERAVKEALAHAYRKLG